MPTYIIPDSFLKKLYNLRKKYETRANTKLDESLQPCAVSIYFGAKDHKSRNRQINFIENCLLLLKNDLKPDLVFASEDEIQHHLKALRILITVCLYVLSDIGSKYTVQKGDKTILSQLLHEAMQDLPDNLLDKSTRSLCLLETKEFFTPYTTAISTNRTFHTKFKEIEWPVFTEFLKTECSLLNEFVENFPVTSIMMPLFSNQFRIAGYSTGYVIGDMLGKSTTMLDARYKLTAAIGSGLYFVLRTSSPMGGVMLVAPTLAGKLLDTYCGVSMAWLFGSAMSIAGKGVGFGVGMTLDLAWKLLFNATSLISSAFQSGSRTPKITGFTLHDPHRIVDGIELKLTEEELQPMLGCIDAPQQKEIYFEIQKEGIYLQIGEETAIIPWDAANIPDVQELYKKLVDKKLLVEDKQEEMTAYVSLF